MTVQEKVASAYLLGSGIALLTFGRKIYSDCAGDIYQIAETFFKDHSYYILLNNTIIAGVVLFVYILQALFFPPRDIHVRNIWSFLLDLFLKFIFADIGRIDEITGLIIACTVASSYLNLAFNEEIESFSLMMKQPTKERHMNLVTAQIITFFAVLYAYANLIKIQKKAYFLLVEEVNILFGILVHMITIFGRKSEDPAFQEEIYITKTVGKIAKLVVSSLGYFFGCNYIWFVISDIGGAYSVFEQYTTWQKFKANMKNLKDPEEENIKDQICIICREPLNQGVVKKLECGHCFHLACIQNWVMSKKKCPYCQQDIVVEKTNEEKRVEALEDALSKLKDLEKKLQEELEETKRIVEQNKNGRKENGENENNQGQQVPPNPEDQEDGNNNNMGFLPIPGNIVQF